jgi:hypothetical protein
MANSRSTSPRPWRTRSGDRKQATHGQRHFMGAAHWRPLARHAGTVRQLEFRVRALLALEQARSVGRSLRNLGESGTSGRRGTCHRFHDCAGASACSRRKRGNQNQEALGRSRGGFSTKVHLRTNAKGNPLTFDVTPGEAHGPGIIGNARKFQDGAFLGRPLTLRTHRRRPFVRSKTVWGARLSSVTPMRQSALKVA